MGDFLSMATRQVTSIQKQASNGGLPAWAWLLIIVFIILLVWWLLVRSVEQQSEIQAHPETELTHIPRVSNEAVMPDARAVSTSREDDFTVLEGIGPKVSSILAEAGITSFAQLASMKKGQLKEILEAAGYRYMDPETWPEQAELLSEGKMDEFKKLVDTLKGGRRR